MMEKRLIELLCSNETGLAEKIRTENRVSGSSVSAYAFIIASLKILFPGIKEGELRECIRDAYRDGELDVILLNSHRKEVLVFDFKNTGDLDYNSTKIYCDNLKDQLLNGNKFDGVFRPEQILEAHSHIRNNKWKLVVYIVRGKPVDQARKEQNAERLQRFVSSNAAIARFHILDLNSLVEESIGTHHAQSDYEWQIEAKYNNGAKRGQGNTIQISSGGGQCSAVFLLLSLKDIVSLQDFYKRNGYDLFDLNVRDFQKKKNLSKRISKSISDIPEIFFELHNGITFTCSKITTEADGFRYSILNPQIINGCQTVSSIYELYQSDLANENLSKCFVLCKFYAIGSKEIIEKVCESTNTQVKINVWDLRSNDRIQKVIEKVFKLNGVNYKRKMGGISSRGTLYMTRLAQWVYSAKFDGATDAKNKKNQLFDKMIKEPVYKKLFLQTSPEELESIYRIGKHVSDRITEMAETRTFEKHASFHFVASIYHCFRVIDAGAEPLTPVYLRDRFKKTRKTIKLVIAQLNRKYRSESKKKYCNNFNYIFTKDQDTWPKIKASLK